MAETTGPKPKPNLPENMETVSLPSNKPKLTIEVNVFCQAHP